MKRTLLTFLALATATAYAAGPIPAGGFRNCKAANDAGYYDIKRGEPAYHPRLDRDGDGVACERSKARR